jgi:hypothetical protein
MKKIILFCCATLILTFLFKTNFIEENEFIHLKKKYAFFLKNSPYKETQKLSRNERKKVGLPPNPYNERIWDLTLDPAVGRPTSERLIETQLSLRESRSKTKFSTRNINTWQERGPADLGGRTRAFLFDPNDINNPNSEDDYTRVFAGSVSGGLWLNEDITDENSSWHIVSGLGSNISVTNIISDPNDSSIMYLGSGESYTSGRTFGQGVWKSTDSGQTWNHIFGGLSGTYSNGTQIIDGVFYINDIIARNNNGNTELYISVAGAFHRYSSPSQWHSLNDQGVYKSTDGGVSWTKFTINEDDSTPVNPNDIDLDNNNNIWLTTTGSSFGNNGGKIFKSIDGNQFQLVHAIAGVKRTEIEPSMIDENLFWMVVSTSSGADIYKTTDNFNTVIKLATEPDDADDGIPSSDYTRGQSFYNLEIEETPTGDIIVGGIDLFNSSDAGNNWSQISKWSNNNNLNNLNVSLVHADQHGTFFRPGVGNENKVVFTNDGGIYYCDDITQASNSTSAIQERNKGYNTSQFYYGDLSSSTNNNDNIAGGTQDNGTWTLIDGDEGMNIFSYTRGGDGAFTEFDDNNDYMIESLYYNSHRLRTLPLETNTTYPVTSNNNNGNFINEAALDKNLDILYCNNSSISEGFQIERNANISPYSEGPIERAQLSSTLLNSDISALSISEYNTNSTTLYVGLTNSGLLRVTEASSENPTWADISGDFVGSISDIEIGASEDEIFVSIFNYGVTSLWFTNDGGASWNNIEGDLPDIPVKCVLKNPLLSKELIIGTMLGIWITEDYTASNPVWVQAYNGMSETPIWDLDVRKSDNTILATTYGRGFFTSKFNSSSLTARFLSALENSISIYPTVNNGTFYLRSEESLGASRVSIFSLTGQNVYDNNIDISEKADINFELDLSAGMYLVKINVDDYIITKKIIVK